MKDLYMDGYLKTNLDMAIKVIRKDYDMVIVVDGEEGCGKSTLAMQMAHYCDPSLTLERVVFTPSEFRKAITTAKKYQAVVYDEAYTGLSSRATMSMINRTLISMLAEIRQRNLFVFVVMPCFFDLDKYVSLWRSRILIHVYTKGFERGRFAFYNKDKKKALYMLGKKYYSYSKPKFDFIGRFSKQYVIDENAYKDKKKHSLLDREKKREEREKYLEVQNQIFDRLMYIEDIDHSIKMKILGMPSSTYFNKLKQWKEKKDFDNI